VSLHTQAAYILGCLGHDLNEEKAVTVPNHEQAVDLIFLNEYFVQTKQLRYQLCIIEYFIIRSLSVSH
jgi:hypothetical protein